MLLFIKCSHKAQWVCTEWKEKEEKVQTYERVKWRKFQNKDIHDW